MWRIFKRIIPTDDILKNMKIPIVSKYGCCEDGIEESLYHLFLIAPIAQKLWRHFVVCVGFKVERRNLFTIIGDWWQFTTNIRAKGILKSIPSILIWELWKRRYGIRHNRGTSYWQLQSNCFKSIQQLIRIYLPRWRNYLISGHSILICYKSTDPY